MKRSSLTVRGAAILQAVISLQAFAAQGDIGPVNIERVAVVAVPAVGHQLGNLELKIQGGFTVPSGLSCDGMYITTLRTTDVDLRLFALASLAQTKKQPVYLRITDDPAYTAFSGRCSLVLINLAQ